MRNVIRALCLFGLAGCGQGGPATAVEGARNAAEFKQGQGLLLTPEAMTFIGLREAEAEADGERVRVPSQALLRTSEGGFVYVRNGRRWLRNPVKADAESGGMIQVAAGLLEGDVVAVAGVRDLWLAELQATKGGVGCADGR